MVKNIVRLALTTLAICGCAAVPEKRPPVHREPLELFSQGTQPGCALGIFGPDGAATYRVSGYADLSAAIRIDENTAFLAASMAKQFTALAVLHLEAAGKLHLGDRAARWVPELTGAVQDATIEELLHQTAGVRDHVNLMALSGIEVLASMDRADTLRLMARQRNTNFRPGTRAQYSNGNYFVLSEIVQRASGESLERYADRIIFRPLGMAQSHFLPVRDSDALAQGYQPDRDDPPGFRPANDRPSTNGSGGLTVTLADLRRFDADFRNEAIVWTPEVKRKMLMPGLLRDGTTAILPEFGTPYGMGLALAAEGDDLRVFHDGGLEGFRSEYVRLRDRAVSVAVLCNRIDGRAPRLADAALRNVAHLAELPAASVSPASPSSTPEPRTPSRALLARIEGNYCAEELDTNYSFVANGDRFDVGIESGFAPGKAITETWGGLQLDDEGNLRSGPIRIELDQGERRVRTIRLSFLTRAEGIELVRRDTSR